MRGEGRKREAARAPLILLENEGGIGEFDELIVGP